MNINTLRKQRNSLFDKISAGIESETSTSKSYEDNRIWKAERDKAGNASATFRFLNVKEGDDLPWAKWWSYGFKGPTGQWYIENSLTTHGKADPVAEVNYKLWNSSEDDDSPGRKQARRQKRKLNYIANILMINDPKHPENNGKVFLFKFGKKIFDKIMNKAKPAFEDEAPVNVFDYWEGANFRLKVKTIENFPNYDDSRFEDATTPLAATDEEILAIVDQQYSLTDYLGGDFFKSYDELKSRLDTVLRVERIRDEDDDDVAPAAPRSQAAKPAKSIKFNMGGNTDEEDDEDLAFFKAKLEEDDD